jgi:hypothetical protein
MPASSLRAQSIAFGRFVYVVSAIIVNQINPYMVSATAWSESGDRTFDIRT